VTLDAPGLLADPRDGRFVLPAHVAAELRAAFDAGALVLRRLADVRDGT
jgi:hypothetical protein